MSGYNAQTGSDAGFTFTSAEVGTTYQYTITSSGGGETVTGSGTVTSTTQDVKAINLITKAGDRLNDGTVTFSVALTTVDGNMGAVVTATASLDTVGPPAFTVTPNETTYTAAQETSASFTLGKAEVGDTYDYSFVPLQGGLGDTSAVTAT